MKVKNENKKILHAVSNVIYPLIAFGIVLCVWAIAAEVKDNPLVLPMPGVVLNRFFKLGGEANFWRSVGGTLGRTVICFLISFVTALFFAAVSGLWKPVYRVISPIVAFLRAAPTVAVILILYAFLDNTELTFTVGFLIAFPVLYNAFYTAVVNVDKDLLEMAKIYKIKPTRIITGIYLPTITPVLFDTSRATLSLTLKVVIAAEILTLVSSSIGNSIQVANATFEIAYLLAWTLIAVVFSFVLEICVDILRKLWEAVR